ncbi:MAG: hypothetical protein WCC66_08190 [Rhizobiaceae bacterium]
MRILRTVSILAFLSLAGATAAEADCKCLNRGVEVPEGKTACIKTGKGPQLALCEKNLNVTNWKFLGEVCPVAGREDEGVTALDVVAVAK